LPAPTWISRSVVLAVQDEQIAEHGGSIELRDEGLLNSALDRPKNRFAYDEPDLFDLAAAYAFGIAKNHPFIDGNKRVSYIVAELFLNLNGQEIDAADAEIVSTWLALAAGEMSEADIAEWLRAHAAE